MRRKLVGISIFIVLVICVRLSEHEVNNFLGYFGIMELEEAKYFQALGSKIQKLRTEKGLDQKAFAFECGIGRTQLHMIEGGKTNCRLLTLIKIANRLEITVSELLDLK